MFKQTTDGGRDCSIEQVSLYHDVLPADNANVVPVFCSKPLLSTRFSNPRLADLAIDAFLNAKRTNNPSRSSDTYYSYDSYDSSSNGKSRDSSIDSIIWFEAFEDLSSKSKHAASGSRNGAGRRRSNGGRGRLNSYTISDDEDDSASEDSEDDEDEESDEDDIESGNAWASTSKSKTEDTAIPATSTPPKIGTSYGCCHISHNNLYFLVPMRRDCEHATFHCATCDFHS